MNEILIGDIKMNDIKSTVNVIVTKDNTDNTDDKAIAIWLTENVDELFKEDSNEWNSRCINLLSDDIQTIKHEFGDIDFDSIEFGGYKKIKLNLKDVMDFMCKYH